MENDTITLRNKSTGEVITLKQKLDSEANTSTLDKGASYSQQVAIKGQAKQAEIAERGTILDNIVNDLKSNSYLKKGLGVLETVNAPFNMLQAGIANPSLQMQQGNFDPGRLLKESYLGLSGQKQGRPGDVMEVAGAPKLVAGGIQLGLDIAGPIEAFKLAKNAIAPISRLSDAGVRNAGNRLIEATKSANNYAGGKLDQAYSQVDNIRVNPDMFYNEMSKLPSPLINKLEEAMGPIEDAAKNMTVGTLRRVKQIIGKYRPSDLGKDARGLAENLEAERINDIYTSVKSMITNTIAEAKGTKVAENLLKLDDAFSKVARATDSIQRTIVDPILKTPSRAGKMAQKVILEGDLSGREALQAIRAAGPVARKQIDSAVKAIEHFNSVQKATSVAKHALGALTYGGAIGAVGGRLIRKANPES